MRKNSDRHAFPINRTKIYIFIQVNLLADRSLHLQAPMGNSFQNTGLMELILHLQPQMDKAFERIDLHPI